MWLRGYLVFFSSLITSHSIFITYHSSLITYHLKYPNSLLSTRLAPSLSYVFNQKTKKNRTHALIQCHLLFFFPFTPDSHLSLPLISLLSASCPTFLSSHSALLSPISRRRWQQWRWQHSHNHQNHKDHNHNYETSILTTTHSHNQTHKQTKETKPPPQPPNPQRKKKSNTKPPRWEGNIKISNLRFSTSYQLWFLIFYNLRQHWSRSLMNLRHRWPRLGWPRCRHRDSHQRRWWLCR